VSEHDHPPPTVRDPTEAPSLSRALRDRWQAEAGRWTTVGEIVLTETRLAGTSAVALLGIALAIAVLALVCWLLFMTLVTIGLVALGLGPAGALGLVLGIHLLAVLCLALLARRLLPNLRFEHTLDALGRSRRRQARPAPDGHRGEAGTGPAEAPDRVPPAPPA